VCPFKQSLQEHINPAKEVKVTEMQLTEFLHNIHYLAVQFTLFLTIYQKPNFSVSTATTPNREEEDCSMQPGVQRMLAWNDRDKPELGSPVSRLTLFCAA
jgi:hypothetical protein